MRHFRFCCAVYSYYLIKRFFRLFSHWFVVVFLYPLVWDFIWMAFKSIGLFICLLMATKIKLDFLLVDSFLFQQKIKNWFPVYHSIEWHSLTITLSVTNFTNAAWFSARLTFMTFAILSWLDWRIVLYMTHTNEIKKKNSNQNSNNNNNNNKNDKVENGISELFSFFVLYIFFPSSFYIFQRQLTNKW